MATLNSDLTLAAVSCVAWKGDILVLGDSGGGLIFWDLRVRWL